MTTDRLGLYHDGSSRPIFLRHNSKITGRLSYVTTGACPLRSRSTTAVLGKATAQTITQNLEVADYRLTMGEYLLKAGVPPVRGSIGTISYRIADIRHTTAEGRAGLDALIRFSAYAGIGDRTTIGMGHTIPSTR